MGESFLLFGLAALLAYVYAFVSGFTDAANAIATSVGSRALSPRAALGMAAVFNLLGGLTGTAVALTIGRGIVDPTALTLSTVIAGVAGAMSWSLITYRLGIPVSETHGLVGGLIGAAIVTAGAGIVQWQRVAGVLTSIVVSPAFGLAGGALLILAVYWAFHRSDPRVVKPWFIHLQRASAAYMSFSHGRNDAQKPMGVLAMAFAVQYELKEMHVPVWIVVSCSAAAALGTWYGGWRIIKTLGAKLTGLNPVQGFAAEVSGATVLQLASEAGVPVSTTHAITSSIVGVGAVRRRSAVRWTVLLEIFASWIFTLPATVLLGAAIMALLRAVLAA